MKKILAFSFLAFGLAACNNTAPAPNSNTTAQTNANSAAPQKPTDSLVTSSHSTPKQAESSTSQNTASPMMKGTDVSEMTAEIEKAEKTYKEKPNDAKAKEALADAYFKRAFVLTEAAQYRAALGDFRKGLKLKPDDTKAKDMHDEIIRIFTSMNREPPKEGEEPPPMPAKK